MMLTAKQVMAKEHAFGLIALLLGISTPATAQLPALPPAPPAPPASPAPEVSPEPKPSIESPQTSESGFIRPPISCPENLDTLTALLLRDIPTYTNRILQSSVADISIAYRPAYVIAASEPEQTPLDIIDWVYTTSPDSGETLQQLFFTTLERQYSGLNDTSINHFHWLFLAPIEDGWQMVFMFSAIDAENEVQLPPRDSSQGSVGQAVQRWLTDCKAGAISVE